jgi:hypothetical protein
MDLLVLAKCGLLQQLIGAYFAGPYWQLLIAACLFSLAQLAGLFWDSRRRQLSPSRAQFLAGLRAVAFVALAFCIACIAIGGLQYLFFVLRISKDTVFCSYFEASRNLDMQQLFTLLALFLANLFLASRFALTGIPVDPPPRNAGVGGLVALKLFSVIAIAIAYIICLWPDIGEMRPVYVLLVLAMVLAVNMAAARGPASRHD